MVVVLSFVEIDCLSSAYGMILNSMRSESV